MDDLAVARAVVDAADAITMDRFRASDLRVEQKPDLTPVSDADRSVETTVRAVLDRHRPGEPLVGEEFGATGPTTGRHWVVDPIDGTKSYVRGVPVWATLLALRDGERGLLGMVSAPALGRRWWAARGGGAWVRQPDGEVRRCRVSGVGRLADAWLSYSSLDGWRDRGRLPAFLDLTERCWRTRAYGDFLSHVFVAEGVVDLACEPVVSLWDLAALDVLLGEAGGRLTDLSGRPGPAGGSVLSSNGRLHEAALRLLEGDPAQVGGEGDPAQVGGEGDPAQVGGEGNPAQVGGEGDPAQVGG